MFKLFAVILLFVVLTKGRMENEITFTTNSNSRSVANIDEYINQNRQKYANMLQDYNNRLNIFQKVYNARLDGIGIQQNMLTDSMLQNEGNLNSLEGSNESTKECVIKYRSTLPTVADTKTSILSCVNIAKNQYSNLLNEPENTKMYLIGYYYGYFDIKLRDCSENLDNTSVNYNDCVTSVINTSNIFTTSNQNNFDTQMSAADQSSIVIIKTAFDCSFQIEKRTISLIVEVNNLISKCQLGL
ncbi:uncharacterized protein LOC119606981 [Lucilia sericata]|uniref:uncharacterized protein LOC119606981 n=1 Tax=Lucilia sericata TaxID=13632 RepID=UPI0018A844EB|nr:uncharacterized protein LOC119606981 [Lucilia sericata]